MRTGEQKTLSITPGTILVSPRQRCQQLQVTGGHVCFSELLAEGFEDCAVFTVKPLSYEWRAKLGVFQCVELRHFQHLAEPSENYRAWLVLDFERAMSMDENLSWFLGWKLDPRTFVLYCFETEAHVAALVSETVATQAANAS